MSRGKTEAGQNEGLDIHLKSAILDITTARRNKMTKQTPTYSQHVPAAVRTLRILEVLASTPEGLTAGQLSEALDIPHSALHALLNTLKSMAYITQAGPRHPYQIGPNMQVLSQPRPLGANTLMFSFSEHTSQRRPEETLALATLSGPDVLVLAEAPCAHTVRSVVPTGAREPAGTHPAGQVLLAGLSEPALARLLPDHSPDLHAALHTVRQNTMAQRIHEDAVTLAVPICPDGYRPEAALLFSIPTFRWNADKGARLTQTLRETAARISHRLGALTYIPYGTARPHHLGTSVTMSNDELYAFLNGPWAARLACVRADGSPHIVTIWYEWYDNAFLIIAWPGSSWATAVTRNPAVALTIGEAWPPLRRVLVRGHAQSLAPEDIPGGPDGLYQRLCVRYLGAAATTASPVSYGTGWQAFRIPPDEVVAQKEIGERS